MSVRAVLVCYRGPSAAYSPEFTFWADLEEVRQAEAELAQPCSSARLCRSCIGSRLFTITPEGS